MICLFAFFFFINGKCDHDPPGTGIIKLYVQAVEVEGLTSLSVKGVRTDVVLSDEEYGEERLVTVGPDPLSVNLVGLADRIPTLVGMYEVPAGYVHQIRFITDEAMVAIDGETFSVKIPSGPQTGVKVVPENEVPFHIVEDDVKHIAILFDPDQYLLHNQGIGYHLKPVVPAMEIEEPELPNYVPGRLIVRFEEDTPMDEVENLCSGLCSDDDACASVFKSLRLHDAYLFALPDGVSVSEGFNYFRLEKPPVSFVLPQYLVFGQATEITPVQPGEMADINQWNMESINAPEAWAVTKGNSQISVGILDTGIDLDNEDLYLNVWINEKELPHDLVEIQPSGFKRADFDKDGVITFYDLNTSDADQQAILEAAGIVDCQQSCPGAEGRGLGDAERRIIDPVDLIYSEDPRFRDGDNIEDGNGYADDIVGWNFVDNNNDPQDTSAEPEYESHGTAVAGIIGAVGDNGYGIAGLNWRTRLIPLKVLGANAFGVLDRAFDAALYAADAGALVSNASFGSVDDEDIEIRQEECNDAMELIEAIGERMLLVVPGGNKGAEIDPIDISHMNYAICPQLSKSVFVVLGTDENRRITADSNRSRYEHGWPGMFGETSAPGVNVPSINRNGTVDLYSGTSIAAAHVTGATALFLAATRNFWLNLPADFDVQNFLWNYMQNHARRYSGDLLEKVKFGNYLDAGRAVSPVSWFFQFSLEESIFVVETDEDGDGLDDSRESMIADAFVPYLVFDEDEGQLTQYGGLSCVNTIFQVTPCPPEECDGPDGLRIIYLFLYPYDYGRVGDSHRGDNEYLSMHLQSTDGGVTYKPSKMTLSRHHGAETVEKREEYDTELFDPICEDFFDRFYDGITSTNHCSTRELWVANQLIAYRWLPVHVVLRDDATTHVLVHASQNKHACYRSKHLCERAYDGWYNEDCDGGPLVILELTAVAVDEEEVEAYNNVGECYGNIVNDLYTHGLTCYEHETAWLEQDFCGGLEREDCTSENRSKWFWYPDQCEPQ